MGNELYQSPPRYDFTCSFLISRDYVPLSGDLTPVYRDRMPVYQDFVPVHHDLTLVVQDLTLVYQDSLPVYQNLMPVHQDIIPVCQDFMPAPQDLPIVKDVCAASDSVSEFISLLFQKVQFPYCMINSTIGKLTYGETQVLLNP